MLFDYALAIAAAFLASAGACWLAIQAGVQDAATQSHAGHKDPTPTSAGLAIAIGFSIGICTLVFPPVRDWNELAGAASARDLATAMIAVFIFLAIGWIDDLWPLPARNKIVAFVLASLAPPLFAALRPQSIPFGAGVELELGLIAAVIGAALWIFTLVNTVNFMDGANGLAMGCTAIGLTFLGLIAVDAERMNTAAVSFCGAAALAGFLLWNFPHGRIFAGDSGALFAGSIAAIVSLLAARGEGISPFVLAMLFMPMLADVLSTLVWRLARGRDLLVGHREHLYQVGLRAKIGNRRITYYYWAATALCGALAWLADTAGRGGLEVTTRDADLDRTIGAILSFMPFAAFVVLVIAALIVQARVRAFARDMNFEDGRQAPRTG